MESERFSTVQIVHDACGHDAGRLESVIVCSHALFTARLGRERRQDVLKVALRLPPLRPDLERLPDPDD